jgi:hypothetical protein
MVYIVPVTPAAPPPPSCGCNDKPDPVFHASVQALALTYPTLQHLVENTTDTGHDTPSFPLPADWPLRRLLDSGRIIQHNTNVGGFQTPPLAPLQHPPQQYCTAPYDRHGPCWSIDPERY